ncbi:helix-turn-helix domain-containing protein [Methylobacter sp. Wu1]|uniref:helix-turn-helix domain-containing protein n=1 Tax=Methylobacter sp. Wu1 TaxID=3119359 RepID=UPI002F944D0F
MSLDATRWAWEQSLKPSQKLLLLSLADRASETNECYPSVSRLEKDTCLDRKTIMKNIQELESLGLISVRRRVGAGNYYKLIGVKNRHSEEPKTSPKNGTGTKNGTSPKNGTTQSQKRDGYQSQKRDTNLPIEPNNNLSIGKSGFVKPSVSEIQAYIDEKQYSINAEYFFNHYEANGWMRGKTKIKSWKACLATWSLNNNANGQPRGFRQQPAQQAQRKVI